MWAHVGDYGEIYIRNMHNIHGNCNDSFKHTSQEGHWGTRQTTNLNGLSKYSYVFDRSIPSGDLLTPPEKGFYSRICQYSSACKANQLGVNSNDLSLVLIIIVVVCTVLQYNFVAREQNPEI